MKIRIWFTELTKQPVDVANATKFKVVDGVLNLLGSDGGVVAMFAAGVWASWATLDKDE